jgi:H+/Cl- antiporter ClcA
MNEQFLIFYIALGLLFGIIAGLMAFLITYIEYVKNYAFKEFSRKMAIKAGVTTFIFFLVLSILAGIFLPGILGS